MKKIWSELIRNEKGQALPLVLMLLVVGGFTIGAVLTYVSTGLNVGQIQEERLAELYAADAGIEDGLWRIQNDEVLLDPYDYEAEFTYTLPVGINEKEVVVNVTPIWLLDSLESDKNGTMPHQQLVVAGQVIDEEDGEYQVKLTYDGSKGNLKVERVGVWLPTSFNYVADSTSGITTENPTSIFEWRGGKALAWDFQPAVNFEALPASSEPTPPGGFIPATEFPIKRILTFSFSPAGHPEGSFSWIRTNRSDIYLSWDTSCKIYKVTATATDAATGKRTTVTSHIFKETVAMGNGDKAIKGDYRAIGNTLMEDWEYDPIVPKRDILLNESSATISDIPSDAEVAWSYLYWSAWREREQHGEVWEEMEADTQVSFKVNDQQVYFDGQGEPVQGYQDISASRWWLVENRFPGYSYSCFKDVTQLVKLISPTGNGKYTVGDMFGTVDNEWSYAGWSLIIIYSSPSEKAHQLYLYDDFLYANYDTSHTFTIEGFKAAEDAEAKLTCFVGEGDECYGDHQYDSQSDAPWGDTDWIKFNDNYLFDEENPMYNVWNGKSSGLSGEFVDEVDIDTFDVSSPIINEEDTSAEVTLGTGVDAWNLVYIILSFRSDVPAGLKPNTVGSITYTYGG